MTAIECKYCDEEFFHNDEMIFFKGNDIVEVSEQYPDWTTACCTTCALIMGVMG